MKNTQIIKGFNPDWKKIDTKLLTKDMSPRSTNTHFIARTFKKIAQEEIYSNQRPPQKPKKVLSTYADNLAQKVNYTLGFQYQQNKLCDRYNSLNGEGGNNTANLENSTTDRYTLKNKKIKKTLDAIHSITKKISAGNPNRGKIKFIHTKDKSQEPRTVKKQIHTNFLNKDVINTKPIDKNAINHFTKKNNFISINNKKIFKDIKDADAKIHISNMGFLSNSQYIIQNQQKAHEKYDNMGNNNFNSNNNNINKQNRNQNQNSRNNNECNKDRRDNSKGKIAQQNPNIKNGTTTTIIYKNNINTLNNMNNINLNHIQNTVPDPNYNSNSPRDQNNEKLFDLPENMRESLDLNSDRTEVSRIQKISSQSRMNQYNYVNNNNKNEISSDSRC